MNITSINTVTSQVKTKGTVKRLKKRAANIYYNRYNPRMVWMPYKVVNIPVSIDAFSSDMVSKYSDKQIDTSYYKIIETRSATHTRGRIIKKMKMKMLKRKR